MSTIRVKPELKESVVWLLWTSIGGLFPVWLGFLVLYFFEKRPTLATFSNNGQFALYAASFISIAFYLVSKEYKTSSASFKRFYIGGGIVCVIAICMVFFIATAARANILLLKEDKLTLIRNGSYVLYVISVLFAFAMTYQDKTRTAKDLRMAESEDVSKLEKEVRAIGDK